MAVRTGLSVAAIAAAAVGLVIAQRGEAQTPAATPTFPVEDPFIAGDWSAVSVSATGAQLIRNLEGLRLAAYWDAGAWAIGYGHRGPDVAEGMMITAQRANELLAQDLIRIEAAIVDLVEVPLSQAQFDALASFVYNVGAGAFRTSTLLERLNAGNIAGAAAEFSRWVYSGGRLSAGLVARRTAEAELFHSGML